jgi:hypothetical protein
VTETKRLHHDGLVLAPHLRGTIYDIVIAFEDMQAVEYAFGIGWDRLHSKLIKEFAPLLIKLIDSELRKDSKRMTERSNTLLKKPQPEFSRKKAEDDDDEDEQIEDDDSEHNST